MIRLLVWLALGLPVLLGPPGAATAADPPRELTLREALRQAAQANPTLKIARLEELIADAEVVRARAGFLPQVKAQVGHTLYDNPVKIRIGAGAGPAGPAGFRMTNRNFWSSQVVAEQTVFDFFATSSRYQAAVLGKSISRLDSAQVRDNLFLAVCQGYFRVLRAEKMVQVAQQEVTQLREHLKNARNLYEVGLTTYNDVLQAEVALADAEQRLITARSDVTTATSQLNKLLALPIGTPLKLAEESELAVPVAELPQAARTALERRPDLKAAEGRIRQGEKAVTQAQAGFYPRVFVQAGQTWQQNDTWLHDNQWFAIVGLQWSLFSGFDTRAQVRQAKERLEQLKLKRQDLSDQVKLEVQTAYLDVKDTAERIRVTQKAVSQGEENLRLNEERYKEQVGTATDVIDAQTLLTKARVNFYNARYDHQMAKATYLWAVGAINELLENKQP
ncbi:MAG: TolC family protein [Syntrophobacterales bacterium]|nr:TolC family protein [Syntrophobacterales bacterium]